MARFAVKLVLPELAWDLLADLEPILESAQEVRSYAVEVVDDTGVVEAPDLGSAQAQSAERGPAPDRITLTVKGCAGPGEAGQSSREYTVSIWVAGLDKSAGAAVNGSAGANGAEATTYAEGLLGELEEQARAFLRHNYLPVPYEDQPGAPEAGQAADPAPSRGGLMHFLANQPLAVQIFGGTITAVLSAAVIAGLTWLLSR